MSGFDKYLVIEELKKLGWEEIQDEKYMMKPPDELLEKAKGKKFYIYNARDVQELLGD